MAEPEIENIMENEDMDLEQEEEEGQRENAESTSSSSSSLGPNNSFLTELNLVLLVSYLSLSAEECLNMDDIETMETVKKQEPKDSISRLRAQKRKLHEPKLLEPRMMQRFQTKIRDCRHCRRM